MNSTNATSAHARKTVRIGGASGFWGDSAVGAPQLVRKGQVDFLVFDYLARIFHACSQRRAQRGIAARI